MLAVFFTASTACQIYAVRGQCLLSGTWWVIFFNKVACDLCELYLNDHMLCHAGGFLPCVITAPSRGQIIFIASPCPDLSLVYFKIARQQKRSTLTFKQVCTEVFCFNFDFLRDRERIVKTIMTIPAKNKNTNEDKNLNGPKATYCHSREH